MKSEVADKTYGNIAYEENFWTGKKTVAIDGVPLQKVSRKEFVTADGKTCVVKGSFFSGVALFFGVDRVQVLPPIKWYETALALLPFIFIMVWGNSVALCNIFPVVGGALGGGISGVCVALNMLFMRMVHNVFLKILIALGVTAGCIYICFQVATVILSAMA
ncbi:MAG: hypothetical protein DBX59_08440 [Bacillota bacterium]|nr:MAG: hypothetical protein DBX59_08440 [Bacillota bacterium]